VSRARFLFGTFSILAALAVLAQPREAHAVPEAGYAESMRTVVQPFFESGVTGSFEGRKGITLRYRKWELPDEKGAIVFLPGRGDPFEVFAESFHDFVQAGYSVYALDERGQGSSDRILSDPQLGYVDKFKYYARDARAFLEQVVNARPHANRFLMAHSMGGAIAAYYLTERPGDFTGAVLVAPMLKINTKPYGYKEAHLIAAGLIAAGKSKHFAPNRGPFDPNEQFVPENEMSTSRVRWQGYHDVFVNHPSLQVGGATVHWVWESFEANKKVHDRVLKVSTPVLILTAEQDQIVDNDEQVFFCTHVKNCVQAPVYAGSRHNILGERDSVREDAIARILSFLAGPGHGQ
jgi:lysophospholipase